MRLVDGGDVGNAGASGGVRQPDPPNKKPPAPAAVQRAA
jgi:hypothetical protein